MGDASEVALVIPMYTTNLSSDEIISLRFSLCAAPELPVVIVHPRRLEPGSITAAMKCEGIGTVRWRFEAFPDKYFNGLRGYNRLLLSPSFYVRFSEFAAIVICQLDALLIVGDLSKHLASGADFLGAPIPRKLGGYEPFMNGGFSLRRIGAALELFKARGATIRRELIDELPGRIGVVNLAILKALAFATKHLNLRWARFFCAFSNINEDVFWSALAPAFFPSFKVGTLEECRAFSVEKQPDAEVAILGSMPAGVHAWYKQDRAFWTARLPGLGISESARPLGPSARKPGAV